MQVNFIHDRLEIECVPITWCNLDCSFCENKGQRFSNDPTVLSRTLNIIKTRGHQYRKINIGFWGGEILADAIDDSIIKSYDHFIDQAYQLSDKINVPLTIDVCTNLIHHRVDWLLKWKKEHDVIISTSYDLTERFSKPKQLLLFKQNVEAIFAAGYNINVNMVSIRPNIEAFYNNDTTNPLIKYLDYLYVHGVNFEIEYYNDVCGIPEMTITPKQLAEFMIFLYGKYPNFANFKHTLPINRDREPEETSKEFIAVYPRGYNVYHYPIEHYNSKALANKLIKQKQCLLCPYFGKCAPRYPIEYEDGEFCITKHIMENINHDSN